MTNRKLVVEPNDPHLPPEIRRMAQYCDKHLPRFRAPQGMGMTTSKWDTIDGWGWPQCNLWLDVEIVDGSTGAEFGLDCRWVFWGKLLVGANDAWVKQEAITVHSPSCREYRLDYMPPNEHVKELCRLMRASYLVDQLSGSKVYA